ncbi:MAG: autotransporter domain-containing protein [Fusobacteriaceae bacterium]
MRRNLTGDKRVFLVLLLLTFLLIFSTKIKAANSKGKNVLTGLLFVLPRNSSDVQEYLLGTKTEFFNYKTETSLSKDFHTYIYTKSFKISSKNRDLRFLVFPENFKKASGSKIILASAIKADDLKFLTKEKKLVEGSIFAIGFLTYSYINRKNNQTIAKNLDYIFVNGVPIKKVRQYTLTDGISTGNYALLMAIENGTTGILSGTSTNNSQNQATGIAVNGAVITNQGTIILNGSTSTPSIFWTVVDPNPTGVGGLLALNDSSFGRGTFSGTSVVNDGTIQGTGIYGIKSQGIGAEGKNNGTINGTLGYSMWASSGGKALNAGTITLYVGIGMYGNGSGSDIKNSGKINITGTGVGINVVGGSKSSSDGIIYISSGTVYSTGIYAKGLGSVAENYGFMSVNEYGRAMIAAYGGISRNEVGGRIYVSAITNTNNLGVALYSDGIGSTAINYGIVYSSDGSTDLLGAGNGGTVINAASGQLISNGQITLINAFGSGSTGINYGMIKDGPDGTDSEGWLLYALSGGTVINASSGVIYSSGSGGIGAAMTAYDIETTAINYGNIYISNTNLGMYSNFGGTIINAASGIIYGSAGNMAVAMMNEGSSMSINYGKIYTDGDMFGMATYNDGTIINASSGVIQGTGKLIEINWGSGTAINYGNLYVSTKYFGSSRSVGMHGYGTVVLINSANAYIGALNDYHITSNDLDPYLMWAENKGVDGGPATAINYGTLSNNDFMAMLADADPNPFYDVSIINAESGNIYATIDDDAYTTPYNTNVPHEASVMTAEGKGLVINYGKIILDVNGKGITSPPITNGVLTSPWAFYIQLFSAMGSSNTYDVQAENATFKNFGYIYVANSPFMVDGMACSLKYGNLGDAIRCDLVNEDSGNIYIDNTGYRAYGMLGEAQNSTVTNTGNIYIRSDGKALSSSTGISEIKWKRNINNSPTMYIGTSLFTNDGTITTLAGSTGKVTGIGPDDAAMNAWGADYFVGGSLYLPAGKYKYDGDFLASNSIVANSASGTINLTATNYMAVGLSSTWGYGSQTQNHGNIYVTNISTKDLPTPGVFSMAIGMIIRGGNGANNGYISAVSIPSPLFPQKEGYAVGAEVTSYDGANLNFSSNVNFDVNEDRYFENSPSGVISIKGNKTLRSGGTAGGYGIKVTYHSNNVVGALITPANMLAVNYGRINLVGTGLIGMYANPRHILTGGLGTAAIVNMGTIDMSGAYNSIAMYATDGGTIEAGTGTVIFGLNPNYCSAGIGSTPESGCDPRTPDNILYSGTRERPRIQIIQGTNRVFGYSSGGIFRSNLPLESSIDFDSKDYGNGYFVLAKYGSLKAPKISGDIYADVSISGGTYNKSGRNYGALVSENITASIKTKSIMYKAAGIKTDEKTMDIVVEKNNFTDVMSNKDVANFLDENFYDSGSTKKKKLYDMLYGSVTQAQVDQYGDDLVGNNIYPTIYQHTTDAMRSTKNSLITNVYDKLLTLDMNRTGSWLGGINYSQIKTDSKEDVYGYNGNIQDIIIGYDWQGFKTGRMGLVATFGMGGAKYKDEKSSYDQQFVELTYHTVNRFKYAELIGTAYGGYINGNVKRYYSFGAFNGTPTGKVDTMYGGIFLRGSHPFEYKYISFMPKLELDTAVISQQKIKEKDADFAMTINSLMTTNIELGAGAKIYHTFGFESFSLTPSVTGMYRFQFGNPNENLTVSKIAEFDKPVDMQINKLEENKNYGDANAKLEFNKGKFGVYLMYSLNFGKETSENVASAGLNYIF